METQTHKGEYKKYADKFFFSFLTGAEKAFIKIQHPFMIKYLRKIGSKGGKPNLKLVPIKKSTTDVICNSEKSNEIEKGKILPF